MASHLSRIIGTEEDRVNCPFYYKIGACRHGDRCSRTHLRPKFSQNILIPHMYIAPPPNADGRPDEEKNQEHFEDFFEEIAEEFMKYGDVELINVVENLGDHMFGNVYVTFSSEEEAEKAMKALHGRFYAGRVLEPEYSPVTDFREARCRQFEEAVCGRGGFCNFVHLKRVPRRLRKMLKKNRKKKKKKDKHRSRSRSRDRVDFIRASSQERRNIIRQWNRERKREKDGSRSKSRSRSRSRKRRGRDRSKSRSSSRKRDPHASDIRNGQNPAESSSGATER